MFVVASATVVSIEEGRYWNYLATVVGVTQIIVPFEPSPKPLVASLRDYAIVTCVLFSIVANVSGC